MALIGYARVSSSGQSLDVQTEQLRAAGCERVFAEKRSGLTAEGREQLGLALDYVREGDVFMVTRLDRLARSVVDLRTIVDRLTSKGVGFRVLQQQGLDTTAGEGKLFLTILAGFAEFEADLRKARQLEGIAKAKAEGVYKGRPKTQDRPEVVAEVRRRVDAGEKPAAVARSMKMARSTLYRFLGDRG
jgi:DNA invertase Pin-like site-specific DNA recombinase